MKVLSSYPEVGLYHALIILILRMRALVLLSEKSMFVSQISVILTSILRINEPIPGMFGLF